jgi:thiamine transport system ATP-binding protein
LHRALEKVMIEIRHGIFQQANFGLAIDLNIEVGDFCAVLGPSGAGKSTLLSIIAGFEMLQKGEFLLESKPAAHEASQRPVSMIFQDHNAFAHLNVWNNVALGIAPSLKLSDQEKQKVADALDHVGLDKLSNRKPGELSGGERQRIALARVLVRNRPILLLDEPFAALDPGLRKSMLSLVSEIKTERNLTVLLVSHQPEDISNSVGKVIFVDQGKVHNAIPTEQFYADQSESIRNYLGT